MHKTILIFILLTTYTSINAQTYRNMEWVKNYGSPDSIEWSATATDVYWNLITIGNTKVSGEKTNMLITKFDNGGSIIWQKDWNGPQNGFDYGADIICDNWGNIYAVGASHYSSDSTFDITVLKYDVSAPAVLSLVKTLGSVNNYIAFNGTSVSAPHVAGVAALLMSYLNDSVPSANNLAPEDVEHIIQATATDVGASGYDIYTGYGRLNAGAALNFVNKDKRRIIHPNNDNPIFIDYTLKSLYASNQTISIAERYENKAEVWFKPGKYKADVYKITADISHSEKMGPYDSIIDAWARHSSSNLLAIYGAGNKLVPHERIYLDTVHFNYVEISGYIYRISDTVGNFMGWWPFDTSLSQVKLAYSVLIKNNYKPPVNVTKIVPTAKGVFVYPNPGNMQQTIKIQSTNPQSLNIELFDVSGRLIKLVFNGKVGVGEHTYSVDVSSISDGIYFYRISLGNSLFHSKTIKQ